MQAAWKIHAPRKIMKGRRAIGTRPPPLLLLLLLLFRVQEQDCKVSRLFCCTAARQLNVWIRGEGTGGNARFISRFKREPTTMQQRRSRRRGVRDFVFSFFCFCRGRKKSRIELRSFAFEIWRRRYLPPSACLRVLLPLVSEKDVHW